MSDSQARMPADSGIEAPFSIQPHPAKSNNPEDLQEGTEKVGAGNAQNVFRQGFIPNQEQAQNLEAPQSRDQLRASAAELNESAHKSSNARP